MDKAKDTTDRRDLKAVSLIEAGKVHLVLGQRFGYVDGSNGERYQVSRDFCECADWVARHPEGGCCHQRALKAVCGLYKTARAEAKATGRVTVPTELYLALIPVAVEPPPCPAHGEPLLCSWCSWERLERQQRENCHTCGELLVGGVCPREAGERMVAA